MLLLINNLSSYLDDLRKCLNKLNVNYVVRKYDEHSGQSINNYDGIILSGRTKNARE